jgi:universal stress protein E
MSNGPDHILVAIADPAARPGPVLDRAADIAARSGAKITLFHSVYSPLLAGQQYFTPKELQDTIASVVESHKSQLDKLAEPMRAHGIDVHVRVRWDYPPHESIVREVLREKIGLLLVGSHPHGLIARLVLTNTDWQLIRSCPCPVLLVKGHQPYDDSPVLISVDPMHANAKPEALDERLLEAGQDFARLFGSPVHVAHFHLPAMALTAGFMVEPVPIPPEVSAQYLADVTQAFDGLIKPLNLPQSQRHLRAGVATEGLTELAKEIGAGVVVMGAVSRSAIRRIFLGSTAEAAIDRLPTDVLVVKPSGFRTDVPQKSASQLPYVPVF